MTDRRLTVDHDTGKLTGAAALTYNDPFPCPNGSYGSGAMMGELMHTMVGNLPGTVSLFNDPARQVSAHFGIAQSGEIHQFGPVGKGWVAWHAMAANETWYGTEHADNGNPNIPLTTAQLFASAQVLECLSAFAGFPLQISDSTGTKGFGTHNMGGAAWGGHTCPDAPPWTFRRSGQRQHVIDLAMAIRHGGTVISDADGQTSLTAFCTIHHLTPSGVIADMYAHGTPGFGPMQAAYIDAGDWSAVMPQGMTVPASLA